MMSQKSNVHIIGVVLVLFTSSLIQVTQSCSYIKTLPALSVTQLTIVAPVVIVGKCINISVPVKQRHGGLYSACFQVEEVVKGKQVPSTFCTGEFGSESACLVDVNPGYRYVVHLHSNLRARYDSHFSAAVRVNNNYTIQLARDGVCNNQSSECALPSIIDKPTKLVVVKETGQLSLNCDILSPPPSVVTWQFRGSTQHIPYHNLYRYGEVLSFYGASKSNEGKYTCIMKNSAGQVSRDVRVIIDPKRCGAMVMVNKQIRVYSPEFPLPYLPDKTCVWRFCPPPGYRIKFMFNIFVLRRYDAVRIDNECSRSLNPWRRYCGLQLPTKFVSQCASGCVQLRLQSTTYLSSGSPGFYGMNYTVEPTTEKASPQFETQRIYCSNDFVLKGKFAYSVSWRSAKFNAVDSYKKPFAENTTGVFEYESNDMYGCSDHFENGKVYFIFGKKKNNSFKVKVSTPADLGDERVIPGLEEELQKYKTMADPCVFK